MSQFSKLQIRAKVLSIISEVKSISVFNEELLSKYVSELEPIEDRKSLFDVFIREYIKLEENEYTFISCLLKILIPKEYVTDKVLDSLKSSLSDDAKYKLVQLLRVVGGDYDINSIPSYFENPEDVLDKETKKLLENAVFNPESMLDFLDFVSAVSSRDRKLLLDSLSLDYQGDVLANIIYPILYSDFDDDFVLDVIQILSESKSSLAIEPFNYLIETSSNNEIVNACQVGLKKLKLAGATVETAQLYFKNIVKGTVPSEFFATIPDGNGNQALLVSRVDSNNKYLLAAIVVNDVIGVIDCFGFYQISQDELLKILSKFYQSEGKYKVSPEYAKTIVDNAISLTIANKRKFPYEFICWSAVLKDIDSLDKDISLEVDKISKCQLIKKDDVLSLLTEEYSMRWFITPNENVEIKSLVDSIYNSDSLQSLDVNSLVLSKLDDVFTEDVVNVWKNRFYNLIYLLMNNQQVNNANKFYTILKDNSFFELFKSVVIQRSIFNYFVSMHENVKDSLFTSNIFTKRNSKESKYDSKRLCLIIDFLKKRWLNE